MLDTTYTAQLAATIQDLAPLATDEDFGAVLAGVGKELTLALAPTEGQRAALYASRAIEIACQRDGVLDQATVAMRAYMAAR